MHVTAEGWEGVGPWNTRLYPQHTPHALKRTELNISMVVDRADKAMDGITTGLMASASGRHSSIASIYRTPWAMRACMHF